MRPAPLLDVADKFLGPIRFGKEEHINGNRWCEITIECPMSIDGSEPMEPTVVDALAEVRKLLMTDVRRVTLVEGCLTLWIGGKQIAVEPDDSYEAWQIRADDGTLIVCTPVGELAVWGPRS